LKVENKILGSHKNNNKEEVIGCKTDLVAKINIILVKNVHLIDISLPEMYI